MRENKNYSYETTCLDIKQVEVYNRVARNIVNNVLEVVYYSTVL